MTRPGRSKDGVKVNGLAFFNFNDSVFWGSDQALDCHHPLQWFATSRARTS